MVRKRGVAQMQPLTCLGSVTGWDANVSLCESGARHMTIRVLLEDPIKGRTSAVIQISEQQTDRQQQEFFRFPQIGTRIVSMTKEDVHVLATVSSTVMTTLLTLAPSNRLRSCLLACHEPYRGQAIITALHIGTDPCEVEVIKKPHVAQS